MLPIPLSTPGDSRKIDTRVPRGVWLATAQGVAINRPIGMDVKPIFAAPTPFVGQMIELKREVTTRPRPQNAIIGERIHPK